MTKDEALQMCLEYIETDAHERKYVRHAIKAALAQPAQEPVSFPCCGYTDANAIRWNQFNGVVQCHMCGQVYTVAQPAQEPVAWQWLGSAHFRKKIPKNADITAWNPLYTTPQHTATWVGLTDEDKQKLAAAQFGWEDLCLAVEAKLKEKNNGT